MENAAKALQIAGGVLIAIIILAVLLLTFRRMSEIPRSQQYELEVAQLTEFNKQFEAYNKKLMYGVDVVSCLNKVLDNNKKSELYSNGIYNIYISIEVKTPVDDEITVYYIDQEGVERRKGNGTEYKIDTTYKSLFKNELRGSLSENKISKMNLDSNIYGGTFPSNIVAKTYNNIDDIEMLNSISYATVNMKKNIYNPKLEDVPRKIEKILKANKDKDKATIRKLLATDSEIWNRVEWKTSAYNFKAKKFKCTNILYKDGRVSEIYFVEVVD